MLVWLGRMGGVCLCEGLVLDGLMEWSVGCKGCWGFVNLQWRPCYYREVSWGISVELQTYSQNVNVLEDSNRTRWTTNATPNM